MQLISRKARMTDGYLVNLLTQERSIYDIAFTLTLKLTILYIALAPLQGLFYSHKLVLVYIYLLHYILYMYIIYLYIYIFMLYIHYYIFIHLYFLRIIFVYI